MTPSKYQRAIEAIRTKPYYCDEVSKACGHLYVYSFWHVNNAFEDELPDWSFTVGLKRGLARASATSPDESIKVEFQSCSTDLKKSSIPRALLIVMLMALEEMDKRGEA